MTEHSLLGGNARPVRHRLIPTRGRARSWFTHGAVDALREAEAYAAANEVPVLVCEAPVDGLVRQLYTVKPAGQPEKAAKR